MPRPTRKKSLVWNHFVLEAEEKHVSCKHCSKSYKFYGNTTNLKEHLKRIHPFTQLQEDMIVPSTSANSDIATSNALSNQGTSMASNISNVPIPPTDALLSSNKDPPTKRVRQLILTTQGNSNGKLTENQINDIDKSLVEMIVLDYQPMSIVEDKGFTRLCQKLNSRYTLPSRKTLTNKLIPQHYEQIRLKVIEDLKYVDHLSATTDYWQADNHKSYVSLTIHYISNYKLISTVLDVREVIVSHTSEHTGMVLKSIFDEYSIFDKIITIVTDNAANMKKAVTTELNKHHHACVAHTLNLSVNEVISHSSEVSRILLKCRTIIGHFKHSVLAANKLREKQADMDLPELKPKQDVPTRWNSAYIMLQRLLELKQPLSVALTELTSNSTPDNLSGAEWSIINDCTLVLKSILRITEELSAEKYVTMSKIVPLIRGLQYKLRSLQTTTTVGIDLKMHLLEVVTRRLSGLESTKLVAKSTFLDPRFKKTGFGTDENGNNAQQWVTEELIKLIGTNIQNSDPTSSNYETSTPLDEDDPWVHFDTKAMNVCSNSHPTSSAVIMVKQYVETPLLPRKEDPLLYWKSHERIFPELSILALKYLCIPATSVPSERIFSKTGYILNKRRSMLKSKKLNEIVFLNSNIL